MPSNLVQISFGLQFVKDLKHLRKKYPNIRKDVDSIIVHLQNGETPGDQVQGTEYTLISEISSLYNTLLLLSLSMLTFSLTGFLVGFDLLELLNE